MNWKDIRGYEGIYEVSDTGKVRKHQDDGSYRNVVISKVGAVYLRDSFGRSTTKSMATIVADAFIDNPYGLKHARVKDYNLGYVPSNIEWYQKSKDSGTPYYIIKAIYSDTKHPEFREGIDKIISEYKTVSEKEAKFDKIKRLEEELARLKAEIE